MESLARPGLCGQRQSRLQSQSGARKTDVEARYAGEAVRMGGRRGGEGSRAQRLADGMLRLSHVMGHVVRRLPLAHRGKLEVSDPQIRRRYRAQFRDIQSPG